jgi:D-3-phosphoglycerate dehydrogenase / 2-oxoglutarate reductase
LSDYISGVSDATPCDRSQVLVTWPDYDLEAQELGGALISAGFVPKLAPKVGHRSPAELSELARCAAAAIVSTDPFDGDVIAACPRLRVIARVGVGVDSIDLGAATARGVVVTVTPGANEATVADHTLALILAAVRRLCEHHDGVRQGRWDRTGRHTPGLLTGATVGLVGYGAIGRLVAERLAGFDVRLLVCDPSVASGHRAEQVPLHELLHASDVVSLHLPLEPGTRGLIGPSELALLSEHAVLVNTARGGIVDEDALFDALRSGRLGAAALDVFDVEPPRGSPLLTLPNVVSSPHNAGLSRPSIAEMTRRATRSVIDVLSGRRPSHVANPTVLGPAPVVHHG